MSRPLQYETLEDKKIYVMDHEQISLLEYKIIDPKTYHAYVKIKDTYSKTNYKVWLKITPQDISIWYKIQLVEGF